MAGKPPPTLPAAAPVAAAPPVAELEELVLSTPSMPTASPACAGEDPVLPAAVVVPVAVAAPAAAAVAGEAPATPVQDPVQDPVLARNLAHLFEWTENLLKADAVWSELQVWAAGGD